ncbi:hypothetical protein V6N12_007106 [Hibiscus sabdariffa]|uniref:Uncharacterized protein n=1 Tax=Hibiscus sabdariffa TaxID=183260 RepID=A0ABR2F0V0_9ROSI
MASGGRVHIDCPSELETNISTQALTQVWEQTQENEILVDKMEMKKANGEWIEDSIEKAISQPRPSHRMKKANGEWIEDSIEKAISQPRPSHRFGSKLRRTKFSLIKWSKLKARINNHRKQELLEKIKDEEGKWGEWIEDSIEMATYLQDHFQGIYSKDMTIDFHMLEEIIPSVIGDEVNIDP